MTLCHEAVTSIALHELSVRLASWSLMSLLQLKLLCCAK